ncbi:MAG: family 20 glycosylhydrolase, partial [Planctomycetota bacterium]|nr:family 20 glycosylhydrolase [Planctomycetota bacterium]
GKLGDPGWRMLDVANDAIYPLLDGVITDICEVFKSSPFFHIGGDEIQFDWYIDHPHVREYIKKNNLRDHDKGGRDDLLKIYVTRLNESVKKNGKKTIFWGGLQGPPLIAALNDCIVYSWYAGAKDAQKAGLTTITVPWEIKVPFNEWSMYNCNGEILDRKADRVLGHSRPMWEMSAEELTRSWVNGMAERQERTWGPDTKMDLAEFRAREKAATLRMAKLTRPIDFTVEAKLSKTEGYVMANNYTDTMTLTMSVDLPEGCTIRYVLDGTAPTAASPAYDKPLKVTGRVRARAAMFDADGQRVGGYTFSERYNYIGHEVNLTTGKPVKTTGGVNPAEKPEFANDGYVDIDKFWGTIPAPQSWQVDLQGECKLDRVQVIPYFDGKRYYQYTVEVSADEKTWTKVVDASANTAPGTESGYLHKFTPVSCRYVKVNVLKNSDNPAVHLLEVRVYEEGK